MLVMEMDKMLDEFIDNFLKFEKKNKMFEVKINNVRIWHYIRSRVYFDLLEREEYITTAQKNVQDKKSQNTLEFWWKKHISCNQFFAHKREVLIVSHGRKYKDDNKYYKCPYTHLLDEYLTNSHYILDRMTPDGNYELQKSHNILYRDVEKFNRMKRVKFSTESVLKLDVDYKIIKPIELYFKINIASQTKKNWWSYIGDIIYSRKYYIKYYSYMLKKIRPKIILIVCAYGFDNMVLCEVAHRINIPVVELQHGTIGDKDTSYNFYGKMHLNSFPDYIFTFGQFEKELAHFPIPKSHIIPVGYPELEKNYKKYKKKKGNKKNILFISQAMIGIAKFANEVAEKIDKNKYQVVFQLHPFEYSCWKTTIGKYLRNSDIIVKGSYNYMVYESLAQADWVVGNYSTVLSEAQMFDVKVAVLKSDMYQAADFLYENGYAILVDSPEQLLKEIEKDTFQPNRRVSLFEKNSLEKMQKNIDEIIKLNEKIERNKKL